MRPRSPPDRVVGRTLLKSSASMEDAHVPTWMTPTFFDSSRSSHSHTPEPRLIQSTSLSDYRFNDLSSQEDNGEKEVLVDEALSAEVGSGSPTSALMNIQNEQAPPASNAPMRSFMADTLRSSLPHISSTTDDAAVQSIEADTTSAPRTSIAFDISVDGNQHRYDFTEFVDHWHRHPMSIRQRPLSTSRRPRPSSHLLGTDRNSLHIRNGHGVSDLQGIRWRRLGTDRAHALAARAQRHPSKAALSAPPMFTAESEPGLYRFRSFTPAHRADFAHYELRHLLAAPDRNAIFYAAGTTIHRTALAVPTWAQPVWTPSAHCAPAESSGVGAFRITSLAATAECVVAGGRGGEFALLGHPSSSLSDSAAPPPPPRLSGYVSHAHDGLITHVTAGRERAGGAPRALFCSNDRTLRELDVASARFVQTRRYGFAVNCVAASPDARLRCLAGDRAAVLLVDAARGDPVVALRFHADDAFACAWAPDGARLATAAQDGSLAVWDVRNWRAPVAVASTLLGGCVRSLAFTEPGHLVVAEAEDVVSVYHSPGQTAAMPRQDLRFFGAIAGLQALGGGEEILVANADRSVGGLMVFEKASGCASTSGDEPRAGRRAPAEDTARMMDGLMDVLV